MAAQDWQLHVLAGASTPMSPFPWGSGTPIQHDVSLDPTSVSANWYLNHWNGLSRVHECDRQMTNHDMDHSSTIILPINTIKAVSGQQDKITNNCKKYLGSVPTYYAAVRRPSRPAQSWPWTFCAKIGSRLRLPWEKMHTNLVFLCLFVFTFGDMTNGRTGKNCNVAYRIFFSFYYVINNHDKRMK